VERLRLLLCADHPTDWSGALNVVKKNIAVNIHCTPNGLSKLNLLFVP